MPQRDYDFWVYIGASRSHHLYIGVTNSLLRRMKEHKAAQQGSYTSLCHIERLVYFEHFQYVNHAIAREKILKDWSRSKKIALIESINPTWLDLTGDWGHSLRQFHLEEQRTRLTREAVAALTADFLRCTTV